MHCQVLLRSPMTPNSKETQHPLNCWFIINKYAHYFSIFEPEAYEDSILHISTQHPKTGNSFSYCKISLHLQVQAIPYQF